MNKSHHIGVQKPLNTLKTRENMVENSREGGRTVGSGVVKNIIE